MKKKNVAKTMHSIQMALKFIALHAMFEVMQRALALTIKCSSAKCARINTQSNWLSVCIRIGLINSIYLLGN